MASRLDDFLVEIRKDEFLRFICVYSCKKGNETKRHILNMAFNVIENSSPMVLWQDVLKFFVTNVIQKYFLPLQSMNVTWESLRVVRGGTPLRHPLNIKGAVNQDIGALDKGLKIELQRAYAKQPSFTYLYGMPINLQELGQKEDLFGTLEELYLDPIGDPKTMIIQYWGNSSRMYGNRIISCTVRGELGKRKKYKSKKRKINKNFI